MSSILPQDSSGVLPQELDELILEFVLDDTFYRTIYETLSQCALVCRAWRPKAHALLFRAMSFDEWKPGTDARTLYDYRRFLDEHPHLVSHIERLVFGLPPEKYPVGHSVYGVLFQVLPHRLPALRTIRLEGYTISYELHRFFNAPYVQMANIANLQLSRIDIADMTEFYHFILRFPNLSSLLIIDCYWKNSSKHTTPRLRDRWRVPAITQLSVAFGSSLSDARAIPRRQGVATLMPSVMQLILQILGANLVHLEINLRAFQFLTSPHHTPNTYELLRGCPTPRLRRLEVHLRCPAMMNEDQGETPYSAYIGRVPTLLKAIDAKDLRLLGLYFSREEVLKSEELFLDVLEGIHGELVTLVEGDYFPKLEKIRLDVGARPDTHSWWKPRLAERLPVLAGRGLLEIVQFIVRRHSRSGPFTDPPEVHGG